jgi:hypothetical protein
VAIHYSCLGCETWESNRPLQTFRRNVLDPSSGKSVKYRGIKNSNTLLYWVYNIELRADKLVKVKKVKLSP